MERTGDWQSHPFTIFFTANVIDLLRLARSIVRDADAAEDVLQDAAIKCFQEPGKDWSDPESLHFAVRVVINASIDKRRRDGRYRNYLRKAAAIRLATQGRRNESGNYPDREKCEAIIRMVELSPALGIVKLRFFSQSGKILSFAKIAKIQEISESTARNRFNQQLQFLREQFGSI